MNLTLQKRARTLNDLQNNLAKCPETDQRHLKIRKDIKDYEKSKIEEFSDLSLIQREGWKPMEETYRITDPSLIVVTKPLYVPTYQSPVYGAALVSEMRRGKFRPFWNEVMSYCNLSQLDENVVCQINEHLAGKVLFSFDNDERMRLSVVSDTSLTMTRACALIEYITIQYRPSIPFLSIVPRPFLEWFKNLCNLKLRSEVGLFTYNKSQAEELAMKWVERTAPCVLANILVESGHRKALSGTYVRIERLLLITLQLLLDGDMVAATDCYLKKTPNYFHSLLSHRSRGFTIRSVDGAKIEWEKEEGDLRIKVLGRSFEIPRKILYVISSTMSPLYSKLDFSGTQLTKYIEQFEVMAKKLDPFFPADAVQTRPSATSAMLFSYLAAIKMARVTDSMWTIAMLYAILIHTPGALMRPQSSGGSEA